MIDELRKTFQDPPADCRPMMRWWWFGPSVERDELTRELEAMHDAGLGGAEVAVVYPLSESTDRYLSKEFLADLRHAADEAQRLGLRFDVTLGSGWPFGGPHVTPDLAARKLHWDRQEVGLEAADLPAPQTWPDDELVAAYVGEGTAKETPTSFDQLPIVDGTIRVPAGTGPRVVLTAVSRLTGQHVKRAAAGAEGLALDHYSAAATANHIEAVCEPLVNAVGPERLGSVFCDSLEVYDADWTPNALAEFEERRGYDPRPRLWQVHVDNPEAPKLRADFYRTLTELLEENFLAPLQSWAAKKGVKFRLQGYGEPPATVSSYRFADIVEGEGWGWKDLPPTRWASSAAQLYGKQIVSSEVWTFVHAPSMRATPLDLQAELHEHLLCGVNHVIGHGWPYSPSNANGLGWIFYAAGALDDRNPWWPAMRPFAAYVQRLCWLLRQGERVSDVGIYVPARDVYAKMQPSQPKGIDLWRRTRDAIGFELTRSIREAGFDFDLFDDDAIGVLDDGRFPIVVVPGANDVAERLQARTPDVTIAPPRPAVGFVHRKIGDVDAYLVANTGPNVEEFQLTPRDTHQWIERWDPHTGDVLSRGATSIPLRLEAYEAAVLVAFDGDATPTEPTAPQAVHELDGDWTVRFGADPTPVTLPHRWEDDPVLEHYSGSATYATTVEHGEGEVWLDLGDTTPGEPAELGLLWHLAGPAYQAAAEPPVGVVAEVSLNGEKAGVLWAPPYRVRLYLRKGANELTIRVSNTGANGLAADVTVPAWAQAARERYGRRFTLQRLENAMDGVSSGLIAVPRLLVKK
ncbi:glycosyl hydrolase [Tenggerimyces flavus]|uniref:Glycosyl hydrolase n=1 Tax=Tenggerimyces flavus TaxID=1708749 RepID=A0ABV7YIV0_9ACTN|nr:glycosyl hydrolase [Tenggerimyces flavus]MBM7787465.1 hypothetical protein [Tenggerimyces flavus]